MTGSSLAKPWGTILLEQALGNIGQADAPETPNVRMPVDIDDAGRPGPRQSSISWLPPSNRH
jgi:hypothetical protein